MTLKGLTPSGTLPLGTLEGGKTAIDQGRKRKKLLFYMKFELIGFLFQLNN